MINLLRHCQHINIITSHKNANDSLSCWKNTIKNRRELVFGKSRQDDQLVKIKVYWDVIQLLVMQLQLQGYIRFPLLHPCRRSGSQHLWSLGSRIKEREL